MKRLAVVLCAALMFGCGDYAETPTAPHVDVASSRFPEPPIFTLHAALSNQRCSPPFWLLRLEHPAFDKSAFQGGDPADMRYQVDYRRGTGPTTTTDLALVDLSTARSFQFDAVNVSADGPDWEVLEIRLFKPSRNQGDKLVLTVPGSDVANNPSADPTCS